MKDEILTLFSKTQWQNLHQEEKLNHSVFDFKQCQKIHIDFLCQFLAKSKMQQAQVKRILEQQNMQNITKQNLKNLNQEYRAKYDTSFSSEVKKVLFPNAEKMDKAKFALSIKRDMENQLKETSLER